MTSRDLNDLSPIVKEQAESLVVTVKTELGIRIIITCTKRDQTDQSCLYLQGRVALDLVNYFRASFGLLKTNSINIVTWTLHSRHFPNKEGKAEAFDIVIYKEGNCYWDVDKTDINADQIPDYKQIAEIGRKIGLKPGADFGDYAHFQNASLPI